MEKMRGEIRHLDDENLKLRRNFDRIRAGFEEQAQLVEVGDNRFVETPVGCFTKTKIYFKLDLTMAGRSCHCLLSLFTGIALSRDEQIMVTNLQNLHF